MKCNKFLIALTTVVVLNSSHMMAMNQASASSTNVSSELGNIIEIAY
jgi:hypothetical protein